MKKVILFAIAFALIGQSSTVGAQSPYDAAKSRTRARSEANANAAAAARSQAEKALALQQEALRNYKLCSQFIERSMKKEGLVYCEKAADLGNAEAAVVAGYLNVEVSGSVDNEKSLKYFTFASESKFLEGAFYAGVIYNQRGDYQMAKKHLLRCFSKSINDPRYNLRPNSDESRDCTKALIGMIASEKISVSEIGVEIPFIPSSLVELGAPEDGYYMYDLYWNESGVSGFYGRDITYSGEVKYYLWLNKSQLQLCWFKDAQGDMVDRSISQKLCGYLKTKARFNSAVGKSGDPIPSLLTGTLNLKI